MLHPAVALEKDAYSPDHQGMRVAPSCRPGRWAGEES
jgi:hypothetical protein